jgi:hypothetical protein
MKLAGVVAVLPLFLVACGVGMDPAKPRVQDIRVLKHADVAGCEFRGMASDDDMEDLLEKARKVYGDTVVLKDAPQGRFVLADIYRCKER